MKKRARRGTKKKLKKAAKKSGKHPRVVGRVLRVSDTIRPPRPPRGSKA